MNWSLVVETVMLVLGLIPYVERWLRWRVSRTVSVVENAEPPRLRFRSFQTRPVDSSWTTW